MPTQSRMRKPLSGLFLFVALAISATPINRNLGQPTSNFYEIREIIDLYRDGQYDIVKAKLVNQGFKVTSTEPDYTLHGIAHEGNFRMEYETNSPSYQLREYGIKSTSFYYFSTEKTGNVTTSDITIELPSYESKYIYNAFNSHYNSESLEQDTNCTSGSSCIHFWGQIGQTNNFKDFVEAWLAYTIYSTKGPSGNNSEYLVFRGDLKFKHIKQEAPRIIKPIKSKSTQSKIKK